MGEVLVQVHIYKVDGDASLQARSDGLYERVCGFNRKIDRLPSAILVQDHGYLGESPYAFFHYILKRERQFNSHCIRLDVPKQMPHCISKLQAVMYYRDRVDGAKGL
jgi:hypothetical protein